MTWSTIVCMLFSFMSSGLLLAAPDGQLLPPVEEIPQAAAESTVDAEAAPAAEAPIVEAEAPAAEAVEFAAEADDSGSPGLAELAAEAAAEQSADSGPKRRVELPEDFVAPDRSVYIPPRPEWVDREPQMIDEVYCIAVSSSLEMRQGDTRSSLNERLEEAVSSYIRDYLGSDQANYFIRYDIQDIRSRLLDSDSEFSDVVEVSLGPMHQSHAMLAITPEFRAELDAKWANVRQTGRVLQTAGLAVGVLVLLSLMFGYFRVDTATKGYYTRRLQMMLAAAILAVMAVGIFYFRSTAELIYRLTM